MTIDLTQIIVALISLVGAVIAGLLAKNKINADKWGQFLNIVNVAVTAAEQLGLTKVIEDKLESGKEKFNYAWDQVKQVMAKHGLSYDDATIKAAIEAAVLQIGSLLPASA